MHVVGEGFGACSIQLESGFEGWAPDFDHVTPMHIEHGESMCTESVGSPVSDPCFASNNRVNVFGLSQLHIKVEVC